MTAALGCADGEEPPVETVPFERPAGLVVQHTADPARAEAGAAWLWGETTPRFGFPMLGFRTLGLFDQGALWTDREVFEALRDEYGFLSDPDDPEGAPVGVTVEDEVLQFNCLSCHADRVAGELIVGASSGSVAWEKLADDLTRIAELGGLTPPLVLEGFTGAPGTHDAWGLGFQLAQRYEPGDVNLSYGFQQSPAWWSRRYKQRLYLDGSGAASGRRTMAAMYLGYGATLEQIQAMEADLDDAWATMVELPVPEWTLTPIDEVLAAEGEVLFSRNCATCHGRYSGEDRTYPDRIEDVGTDPLRYQRMGAAEVAYLAGTWFGEDAGFEVTNGYLAPVLHGVWASPPYLHNGSVPTLWEMLDSTSRPDRWVREGHGRDDYDEVKVGLKYRIAEPGEAGAYDTTRAGLFNTGHSFGDFLSDEERFAVIEYLKLL